jgi:hypothetical protein
MADVIRCRIKGLIIVKLPPQVDQSERLAERVTQPTLTVSQSSMNMKRKATSSLSAAVTFPSAPKKLKQGSLTAFFGSPTLNKDVHTTARSRFDKKAWVSGLTEPQKNLLKYIVRVFPR